MDIYTPIKVKASHKDYPNYEESNSNKKFVFMDGKIPVKEVEWDLGKIELGTLLFIYQRSLATPNRICFTGNDKLLCEWKRDWGK